MRITDPAANKAQNTNSTKQRLHRNSATPGSMTPFSSPDTTSKILSPSADPERPIQKGELRRGHRTGEETRYSSTDWQSIL